MLRAQVHLGSGCYAREKRRPLHFDTRGTADPSDNNNYIYGHDAGGKVSDVIDSSDPTTVA